MLRVVGFEGGPCGGKSTAIEYIANHARGVGIDTVVLPEVAGDMIADLQTQGKTYQDIAANKNDLLRFQAELLHTIAASIKQLRKQHTYGGDRLVLADRVDNAAYISPDDYDFVLSTIGFDEPPMYSLVDTLLYFPTVAKQDPNLYRLHAAHNTARYEDVDAAIATCDANFATVAGHPNIWLMHEHTFETTLRYSANIALRGFGAEGSLQRVG